MEHAWFQRLRRINQLGLTQLVYPGAIHTRFHHALGALHLMTKALDTLEQKGVELTTEEKEATLDTGHFHMFWRIQFCLVYIMKLFLWN